MTIATTGTVLWFTGLSGSGKTTLGTALKERLLASGRSVEILDGDAVRASSHRHLSFSREDIRENNRLLSLLAAKSAETHDFVIVSVIAPFREDRAAARKIIGEHFVEVFIDCPLPLCIERDVKGLYRKALNGEIKNFIGVSKTHPYEAPEAPDIALHTDTETSEESLRRLLTFLQIGG